MSNAEKIIASICGADGSDEITSTDRFLGDDSISLLCEKLKNNHLGNKRRLILRGNCIETSGAKALADLLTHHHHIQYLSLEWNQIANAGVKYIATSLIPNQGLLHLDLKNNGISNEGAIALASALESNNRLQVLDLRWNRIEDNGALAFKHALLDRDPKLTLLLAGNPLTESTTRILDEWTMTDNRTQYELPLPTPPPNNQPTAFQNEQLQREIASLRQQCMSLQSVVADVQRQLDGSSLRVTDLEQQLSREEYRYNHLNESLKHANGRIAAMTEEQKALCAAWEKERAAIRDELAAVVQMKNDEVRVVAAERDAFRDKLNHAEEDCARLKTQLQSLTQQYTSDRAVSETELRSALNRANDSAVSEAKLKSEVAALRASGGRLGEKVALLEEELAMRVAEHEKALRAEADRYSSDMERTRAEHKQAMDRAAERQSKQMHEISGLHTTISQLKSQHANRMMALEQQFSESLAEMRGEEKTRTEQTIRDLKQRLELVTQARAELDQRAHSLSAEMKAQREEHLSSMDQVRGQLTDMENELQRQRSQNTHMKTTLSAAEADGRARATELEDLRKKVSAYKDQAENWNKELLGAVTDKQALHAKVDRLEQQAAAHGEARAKEFSLVARGVVRAVEKELETLRVDLKIRDSATHSGGR